ncbi:2-carboxy-D-arabinitol-1-phosphatase [Prochlorococcus marinus]|uniref:2-carboxy-D-arabinitol-1-phosphatase n=1 Tax=Prochlorococcus marinus TaxID=1219 RepID=UPI0022B38B00|nr:histidine phosphatase family protein [Prochlorococcus marinus]
MTLRLLLIRHGLSTYNLEKRIQGRNDLSTLTEKGILQAAKTGLALKDLNIDAIYSSPLKRAADTTKELSKHHPQITTVFDNDLLEVDLGPWSGLTVHEVKEKFPDLYLTWKDSPNELTLQNENGNSYKPIEELMHQSENFLQNLYEKYNQDEDKNIVIVAHNAILRSLILKILNKPNIGYRRIKLDNSSISIFNINSYKNNEYDVQIQTLNNTAHLEQKLSPKGNSARIILVRHGETDWNKAGRFQGQIDVPLNEKGKQQAISAGNFLEDIVFDQVFCSSMSRPIETAQIILRNHPPITIQEQKGLIEIGHGLWEGKLESEISLNWNDLLTKWKQSPQKVQMPQGENIEEVSKRAMKSWKLICKKLSPHETALVVAHDAVNKTIICNLLGLSTSDIWKIKQGNGGITIIDLKATQDDLDVITSLNITSHLGGVIDKTAQGAL